MNTTRYGDFGRNYKDLKRFIYDWEIPHEVGYGFGYFGNGSSNGLGKYRIPEKGISNYICALEIFGIVIRLRAV